MELRWMKKKTVITTETREVWVIRQAVGVVNEHAQDDGEIDPANHSRTPKPDPHRAPDLVAEEESITQEIQE
jgi:hypothetical protein